MASASPVRRMLRAVRIAEAAAFDSARETLHDEIVRDVGTGFTIIKLRQPPLAGLIDRELIGPEEIQAASDIERAWLAIDGRARLKSMSLCRVDGQRHAGAWPGISVRNFQSWARHWTARRDRCGDPMFAVVIMAVIHECPVRAIALEIGRRHSVVEAGLVCGLRHYAAWSGFVTGYVARRWLDAAETAFDRPTYKKGRPGTERPEIERSP